MARALFPLLFSVALPHRHRRHHRHRFYSTRRVNSERVLIDNDGLSRDNGLLREGVGEGVKTQWGKKTKEIIKTQQQQQRAKS